MCLCSGMDFFLQAEDGIRDLVRSRGLGDVYKRQVEFVRNAVRMDIFNVDIPEYLIGAHVKQLGNVVKHRIGRKQILSGTYPIKECV